MDEGVSPTLRQWQLAEFLRDKREQKNWTMEDATERLKPTGKRWSRSKVQRIEHRLYVPKPAEVEQIAEAYELSKADSAELLKMCQDARKKGWWQSSALPSGTHTMAGLERAADTIRQFSLSLIPGLLQTSDYMRSLITAMQPLESPESVEGQIAARLIRQHILKTPTGCNLHLIVAEPALRWPVGGSQVMAQQVRRLVEAQQEENITVQVLPFTVGATPGMEDSFTVLTLPQLATDIGYVEGIMGSIYLETQDDVRTCVMRFATLSEQALSPTASTKFMRTILENYQQH